VLPVCRSLPNGRNQRFQLLPICRSLPKRDADRSELGVRMLPVSGDSIGSAIEALGVLAHLGRDAKNGRYDDDRRRCCRLDHKRTAVEEAGNTRWLAMIKAPGRRNAINPWL
jgi:hypothetical protein